MGSVYVGQLRHRKSFPPHHQSERKRSIRKVERESDPPTSDVRELPRARPRVIDHSNFVGRPEGSSPSASPATNRSPTAARSEPETWSAQPDHRAAGFARAQTGPLAYRHVRLLVNRCGTDVLRVAVFRRSASQLTAQPRANSDSLQTARMHGTGYVAAAGTTECSPAKCSQPARRALVHRRSPEAVPNRRPARSWSNRVGCSRAVIPAVKPL